MATDLNKVVTVGYLQSYDRLIKQAYKSADNTLKTDLLTEIGKINSFEITIVTELPTTGVTGTFYLIKATEGEYNGTQNVYKEYLWYKKKDADETAGTPAEYDWELVGDTKLDLDELKGAVDTECIKSIDVTHSTEIIEGTTIAVTTYTVQYKNGKGEEIDTEVFSAVTGVGDAVSAGEGTSAVGGLMSGSDKAKLDGINVTTDTDVDVWFDSNWSEETGG